MSSYTISLLVEQSFSFQSFVAPRKAAVKLEKEERNEGEKKKDGETSDVAEQKEKKRLQFQMLY